MNDGHWLVISIYEISNIKHSWWEKDLFIVFAIIILHKPWLLFLWHNNLWVYGYIHLNIDPEFMKQLIQKWFFLNTVTPVILEAHEQEMKLLITQMWLGHRLSALPQLHLHSRLNNWLQWIGQRQLQDRREILKFWNSVRLILEI